MPRCRHTLVSRGAPFKQLQYGPSSCHRTFCELAIGSEHNLMFRSLISNIRFGYNNAVAGGLLSLPSWIETFPQIDTTNTTGVAKADSSRLQGTVVALYVWSFSS